jgi:hypothetical protein
MIIYIHLSILFSFILSVMELEIYIKSNCNEDSNNKSIVIFNFILMTLIKYSLSSLFVLEILQKTPYKAKHPLVIPLTWYGICSGLQMPYIIYDYGFCEYRGGLMSLKSAYGLALALLILLLTFFSMFILFLSSILFGWRRSGVTDYFMRIMTFVVVNLILLVYNIVSILVTWGQVGKFLPCFFFDNFFFYSVLVLAIYMNYMKFYKGKEILFEENKGEEFFAIGSKKSTQIQN